MKPNPGNRPFCTPGSHLYFYKTPTLLTSLLGFTWGASTILSSFLVRKFLPASLTFHAYPNLVTTWSSFFFLICAQIKPKVLSLQRLGTTNWVQIMKRPRFVFNLPILIIYTYSRKILFPSVSHFPLWKLEFYPKLLLIQNLTNQKIHYHFFLNQLPGRAISHKKTEEHAKCSA